MPAPWQLRGDATAILFRRGVLVFVRYTASNVGPYDELLWLELFQRSPAGWGHHVPAIFVSSDASAQSGRANWGFPKELAEFRVSALGHNEEAVHVTRAGQPIAAFVQSRGRGALPIALGRLPNALRRLIQISEGRIFETVPEARARASLTRISELQVNRQLLPHARSSRWRVGLHLSSCELLFPAARIAERR